MDFNIPNVSADIVIEAIEGIYYSRDKGLTKKDVATYIGKSEEYTRRALVAGMQLKF